MAYSNLANKRQQNLKNDVCKTCLAPTFDRYSVVLRKYYDVNEKNFQPITSDLPIAMCCVVNPSPDDIDDHGEAVTKFSEWIVESNFQSNSPIVNITFLGKICFK